MAVDSYRFLPRAFRAAFERTGTVEEAPVWADLEVPVEQATVALVTSAGLYLAGSQPPFDEARERREPAWGDPTYRVIPRGTLQAEIGAMHLHLNTRDFLTDFNVALPLDRFLELEQEGRIGRLAEENYSFMGYQESGARSWREEQGPEVAARLRDAGINAVVLAPA